MKNINKLIVLGLFVAQMGLSAVSTSHTSVMQPGYPTLLGLKAGMMVGDGDALPGIEAQIVGKLNTEVPLYAGAETGLYFYSGAGESAVVFPILGTIYTQFTANASIHPTLGMSAGPAITTGAGFNTARFMLLFNPGINFALGGMDLALLARFGVLGSSFIVAPQMGLVLPI